MKREVIFATLVVLIATVEFFASNELLRGYLREPEYLAKELKSAPDALYEYRLSEEAPFKYRLLFPTLIQKTQQILFDPSDNEGFYLSYKYWSLIFYAGSALAFFYLMLTCGFSPARSFLGTSVYLIMPAMTMAYTLPIHTREDTLGYTIFFVGLAFIIQKKRWPLLIVAVLGALTRETLLLLPLLYLLFGSDDSLGKKLLIFTVPVMIWLLVRFLSDQQPYDIWLGLKWNLDNPAQVVGFTFIAFNFLWLFFLLHYLIYKRNLHYITMDLRFFYRSSITVLLIILGTTFIGGIFNEIRLLQLFAPWMVIFFLDILRGNRVQFRNVAGTKNYLAYGVACGALCAALLWLALHNRESLITPGKYAVPYDQWIVFSVFYVFILLLFIPPLVKIFFSKDVTR